MRLETTKDVDDYFRKLPVYEGTDYLNLIIWENGTLTNFVEKLKTSGSNINLKHILVHHSVVNKEIDPKEFAVLFNHTKSIHLPNPLTDEQQEAVVHGMVHSGYTVQEFTVARSD